MQSELPRLEPRAVKLLRTEKSAHGFERSPPPTNSASELPKAVAIRGWGASAMLMDCRDAHGFQPVYDSRTMNRRKTALHKQGSPEPHEINALWTASAQGRYLEAANLARTMTARFPRYGFGWLALGAMLKQMGQNVEALAAMRKAAALTPGVVEVHYNLGTVLNDLGQLDEAEASYQRALQIKPDYAEAHYNLGNPLKARGRLVEAGASYRRALQINPDDAAAHNNLGLTLVDLGRPEGAEDCYRRALQINPDDAAVHNNLGLALVELGRPKEAEASYRRALQIRPNDPEAHTNLGNALQDLGQLSNALACYHRALQIKPDFAEAHYNLGNPLRDFGQLSEAVASLRRALEIKPGFACHSSLLFTSNLQARPSASELLAEARRFGDAAARMARPYSEWRNAPETGRRLRVGLLSGDLCSHPVGYFVEGMLAALATAASDRLELFAYPSHSQADALTERIKAYCSGWHSAVRLSDESLAQRIYDDGIDILIDLSGHTAYNRLPVFALKPAPIQASWLGYFATTGVAAMDYLIADPWTLAQSEEAYFTEKIWRLPETRLCFTAPNVEVAVSSLPALANGYVTFGCFNNLAKMLDDVVALWARVLQAVPGSRLFLKATQIDDVLLRQRAIDRFAAHGIDIDRLILEGGEVRAKYLAAYQRVDIALDPFPYTGGTTSVEGLWMGVPLLTLAGESFLSRQGVGLLMNAGLPEWIATDAADYVQRAVSHASDLQRLATLRLGLRQQVLASPIFDAPRFAGHFEAALRGMWQKWCDQQKGAAVMTPTAL